MVCNKGPLQNMKKILDNFDLALKYTNSLLMMVWTRQLDAIRFTYGQV